MMKFYRKFVTILCLFSFCSLSFANKTPIKDDQWDGEQYVNNSDLQHQWATSYIQKLQLQGHEKILDIGCGDGHVSALIAKAVPDGYVLGVDPSNSMLQAAQNLLGKTNLNNLSFTKRNATKLGFENEFDFIVSFSCFHWIPNHLSALQEIERALKPGGQVFLFFAPDHGKDRFDHAIDTITYSPKWAHYFTDFSNPFSLVTPANFTADVEKAHLLLRRMEIITVDEVFPNKSAFAAWVTGWMPHLKRVPKEQKDEFLEDIINCYLKKHPIDNGGKLHFIDYWIEIELIKST